MVWNYSNYSKINPEVAKHFPFSHPRQFQLETISEITEAINKGYKYIVLEAGTGTGKSAIAATLSGMFDSSYILTVTKQLQDQYMKDFSDLGFKLVKGRGNFQCRNYKKDSIIQSCDLGKCVVEGHSCKYSLNNHEKEKITKENTCEYYYQKYMGLNSKVTVANYHYMFMELNYVSDFSKRDLMICDEAHNIESMMMNQLTLEFDRHDLKEYLKFNLSKDLINQLSEGESTDWITFVEKIRTKYQIELSKIENIDNPQLREKKIFIKNMIGDCERFLNHFYLDSEMWIFDYDKEFGIAKFKPLKIDNYATETLFKHADVCIFMSATILDYRLFAHWLGISPDDIYAIRRKSPFNIKRNPIKIFKSFNMSYGTLEKTAPQTIPTIREILDKHKNEKGIIHTVSTKCRDFLIDNIKTDRFISHDTQNRSEILEKFKSSTEPKVLVSPSVNEGVDLPGDECRFQIIYKIPYPDLGDRQISMRNAIDPKWYDYKTSLALVQTHGRGMRFEDDYCTTYFIDSRLDGYLSHDFLMNHFIPDTFTDAIENFSNDYLDEKSIMYENWSDIKEKTNLKYELIQKGNNLLNDGKTEKAIAFYNDLIQDELFSNDYYPYLKLSEIYSDTYMFEEETQTIVKFFKSGIHVTEDILNEFKKRLMKLDKMGYFDYKSNMEILEYEFMQRKNVHIKNTLPLADKIIKNRLFKNE
ncbi:MAG: ATP-dependent DNA helicase [Methanobrevibacter sp.]|nr:ATP-dependent DNA helicase [Methanobrevibacter sp.]MBE6491198.1 ATP-dependent DNA helicase [Methanobrevibacter sp.]